MKIDAQGLYYRDLNERSAKRLPAVPTKSNWNNVNGQYFIGDGINQPSPSPSTASRATIWALL